MRSDSITYLFTIFATRHRDALEKGMAEIGLHAGQIFVLNCLWQSDGQSQAELAKRLKLSAPTIFNMVGRMADSGLVQLRKDDNDARLMRVFLTEKSRDIKPQVEEQWQKLEDFTFRNLTDAEKMMFSMLLQKIIGSD